MVPIFEFQAALELCVAQAGPNIRQSCLSLSRPGPIGLHYLPCSFFFFFLTIPVIKHFFFFECMCGRVPASRWVLGAEPESPGRAASALNLRGISKLLHHTTLNH